MHLIICQSPSLIKEFDKPRKLFYQSVIVFEEKSKEKEMKSFLMSISNNCMFVAAVY